MNKQITYFSQVALPVVVALDATGVKLRVPVVDNISVVEFGIRVVGATATGTALVAKLYREPVAGGSAVELAVASGTTTVTQGQALVRRCDVHVLKADASFITVDVTTAGATGATGIVYIKAVHGGSLKADANEVVVTA